MPKLLDLFSGAGGAAVGYHRAGFEVTGIDIAYQKNYPFEFIQADALEYVAAHGHEYDIIHASPPCQLYSQLTPTHTKNNHPDLIGLTRAALIATGKPYIIENVRDARKHLINPVMLCGSMFGLMVQRHRYFECSWGLSFSPFACRHDYQTVMVNGSPKGAYGRIRDFTNAECQAAMGIDWMTRKELDESIPPAFTEWLGRQAMAFLAQEGA